MIEDNYPISIQPVEADNGRVIGAEISQLTREGKKVTWTFSTIHLGPNSGHFPATFSRGPLLLDTSD